MLLEVPENPKQHPANRGMDFAFDGGISQQVLRNYLSRSICFVIMEENAATVEEDIRFLLYTGAKYIARSYTPWQPDRKESEDSKRYKQIIETTHIYDPDVIFEACIFETAWKTVENFSIPAHVFQAFDLPAESRNFRYEEMIYSDGSMKDIWGSNGSCPDITRTETQLFFYFRACLLIDIGFEAIHWGQVHMIGRDDKGFACYSDLLKKVRMYAAAHARRHFILHNAHTNGILDTDGKLMFDFHASPLRNVAPEGQIPHPASEQNPQLTVIDPQFPGSIYRHSLGGTTQSGWNCVHLPYFVELDNYGGIENPERINQPNRPYWPWGFDEISWFANQPSWYRREWLDYAYREIQTVDPDGYFEMPGNRLAFYLKPQDDQTGERTRQYKGLMQHCPETLGKLSQYFANSSAHAQRGMDDEETIRNIWIQNNSNT